MEFVKRNWRYVVAGTSLIGALVLWLFPEGPIIWPWYQDAVPVMGGILGYDETDHSSPFVSKSVNFIFGNSESGGYQIAATFATNGTFKEPQIVRVIFDNVKDPKDPGTCKLSQTGIAGNLTAYTNPWGTAKLDEKVRQDYWRGGPYDRHLYQTSIKAFPNKTYELDCRLQTIPLVDGAHRTVVFIPPKLVEQGPDSPSGFDYVHGNCQGVWCQ
jgi:hypothetical protein